MSDEQNDNPVLDAANAIAARIKPDHRSGPRQTARGARALRSGNGPRHVDVPVRDEPQRQETRPAEPRLKRNRKRGDDRFYVDPKRIPTGESWEWKAESVYGKKQPDYIQQMEENHWHEVDSAKHRIITRKDGMILMSRPSYLTEEARLEDYNIARGEVQGVQNAMSNAPRGTLSRDHPSAQRVTGIKSEFGAPIPGDNLKEI